MMLLGTGGFAFSQEEDCEGTGIFSAAVDPKRGSAVKGGWIARCGLFWGPFAVPAPAGPWAGAAWHGWADTVFSDLSACLGAGLEVLLALLKYVQPTWSDLVVSR